MRNNIRFNKINSNIKLLNMQHLIFKEKKVNEHNKNIKN